MAPELFQNGPQSTASDLWALGCILYECAAGRPPFAAGSLTQLVQDNHGGLTQAPLQVAYQVSHARLSSPLIVMTGNMILYESITIQVDAGSASLRRC